MEQARRIGIANQRQLVVEIDLRRIRQTGFAGAGFDKYLADGQLVAIVDEQTLASSGVVQPDVDAETGGSMRGGRNLDQLMVDVDLTGLPRCRRQVPQARMTVTLCL